MDWSLFPARNCLLPATHNTLSCSIPSSSIPSTQSWFFLSSTSRNGIANNALSGRSGRPQIDEDHRAIRTTTRESSEPGDHLKILKSFADDFHNPNVEDTEVTASEINFALQLASPEVQGGVVIALLHPDRSQFYDDGYVTRCRLTLSISSRIRWSSVISERPWQSPRRNNRS